MEYQTKISQKLSYKKILTKAENKIYNKNQSILIKKKTKKKPPCTSNNYMYRIEFL